MKPPYKLVVDQMEDDDFFHITFDNGINIVVDVREDFLTFSSKNEQYIDAVADLVDMYPVDHWHKEGDIFGKYTRVVVQLPRYTNPLDFFPKEFFEAISQL